MNNIFYSYTNRQYVQLFLFLSFQQYSLQLDDGFLKTFLDETKGLSFAERGERLINAQGIIDTHMESAQEGQTEVF